MSEQPIGFADAHHGPQPEPTSAWRTGHDVQFYHAEDFLLARVCTFLHEGVRAGQPLIVIATRAHQRSLQEQLKGRCGDVFDTADITWLDARETLAAFIEGGDPNRELFEATIGNVFEKVIAKRNYLVVRAYGEMVNLLWADGNVEGAFQLEQLWNGLATKYPFNLLCAYSMANTFMESHPELVERICAQHGNVMPKDLRA